MDRPTHRDAWAHKKMCPYLEISEDIIYVIYIIYILYMLYICYIGYIYVISCAHKLNCFHM